MNAAVALQLDTQALDFDNIPALLYLTFKVSFIQRCIKNIYISNTLFDCKCAGSLSRFPHFSVAAYYLPLIKYDTQT